jgi:hypothetical protein
METTDTELLKNILENLHNPAMLDAHPWACRAFVKESLARHPELRREGPGRQLVAALGEVFPKIRPATPPRRGKRLDSHWGEFGILASLYFAPLQFGLPVPRTLREAWGQIDPAILCYVNGHESGAALVRLTETYTLVGREPEVAPVSTLSDWHRKGIEKLAEAVRIHEQYLQQARARARQASAPSTEPGAVSSRHLWRPSKKAVLLTLAFLLAALLGLGGYQAWKIYPLAMAVREDIYALRQIAASARDARTVLQSGALLSRTRRDFAALQTQVEPLLWLGPSLSWVPVYGGDLAASRELLQMADSLLESADMASTASQPMLAALSGDEHVNPAGLVDLLGAAQPELLKANDALDQALQLRDALDMERLSPRSRSLIEENLDPLLPVMDDALTLATSLPGLLGASSDGPKTYLLMVQNEDELRPTGGFITAIGTLVVQDGNVVAVSFVDSGELDNWERPYPMAPWQLQQYMNSPVLVLRDANWYPDFPTSALSVETLYAYSSSHSVDGVIAFDQHMLVSVLDALGPVQVEGEPDPIGAGNVIAFMRASKAPPAGQPLPQDWSNKAFMDKLAHGMLARLYAGGLDWEKMGRTLYQGLDQHHLLLRLDDAGLTPAMVRHGWDGAVRYAGGDFLMAVDANVGFNKTNAVVEASLAYDLDLTDLANPLGTLTITHDNHASPDVPCVHWGGERLEGQREYPIDACYWNYMRVYLPAGAELLDATAQDVPEEWMILGHGVHGPVDTLDEELDGLQGFGTLIVVPGGGSSLASFKYHLPAGVLIREGERLTYRLKVEKQPGTEAVPIIVRLHLPNGASVEASRPQALIEGNHLYLGTDLRTDLFLEVRFLLK